MLCAEFYVWLIMFKLGFYLTPSMPPHLPAPKLNTGESRNYIQVLSEPTFCYMETSVNQFCSVPERSSWDASLGVEAVEPLIAWPVKASVAEAFE